MPVQHSAEQTIPARVFSDPGPESMEAFFKEVDDASRGRAEMQKDQVVLLPNFVAAFGVENRVFHLHPCQHVKQGWPPPFGPFKSANLREHVIILKVCEHCAQDFMAGAEMGFDPEVCESSKFWTLKSHKYDDLKSYQQSVYRK